MIYNVAFIWPVWTYACGLVEQMTCKSLDQLWAKEFLFGLPRDSHKVESSMRYYCMRGSTFIDKIVS